MISTTHQIYVVSIGQMEEMIFKLVIVKGTKVTSKQENMGEGKRMKIEQGRGQRRRRQCCKPLMLSCRNYLSVVLHMVATWSEESGRDSAAAAVF
ncbi:hypothetical protein SLE2022_232960 [Rubroshorea leprosula]